MFFIIIIVGMIVLMFAGPFGYNFLHSTQNYGKQGYYSRWQSLTQGGSKKKK
jgi:hypothetical protein